jgi:hypothetical protein
VLTGVPEVLVKQEKKDQFCVEYFFIFKKYRLHKFQDYFAILCFLISVLKTLVIIFFFILLNFLLLTKNQIKQINF